MPLDRHDINPGAWSSRAPHLPGPQLPAFCRSRRPTVMVTAFSLVGLRGLVLLGLHPGSGATAVAPGERGGHDHRLEPEASASLTTANRT